MATAHHDQLLPTRIVLPRDSAMPTTTHASPAPADGPHQMRRRARGPWQVPHVSEFLTLRDDRDRSAWFHFCHGHHLEFLYWQGTVVACDRASAAVASGDVADLARWIDRLDALIRGSGAMLSFCGAFDTEVYDPLLRVSMAAQRDDFSGDMSRDFLAMMRAKQRLLAALTGADGGHPEPRRIVADAERYWYRHHGEVVLALHPGDSLLKEKIDALSAHDHDFDYHRYISSVVRGEEALGDYDHYFGVDRVDGMSLDDYWTQAVAKVDVVHQHFDLRPRERTLLMRGDAALLAIVSEQRADAQAR